MAPITVRMYYDVWHIWLGGPLPLDTELASSYFAIYYKMQEPRISFHILSYTLASVFLGQVSGGGICWVRGIYIVCLGRYCQAALQTGQTNLQASHHGPSACKLAVCPGIWHNSVTGLLGSGLCGSEPEITLWGQMFPRAAGSGPCGCCHCQISKGRVRRSP